MDGQESQGYLRLFLEENGEPVVYTIGLPYSVSDMPGERFNIPQLARRDDVNLSQISQNVRQWSQASVGVRKTTLSYTGKSYAVAVLADFESLDHLRQLNASLNESLPEEFWQRGGKTYMLGTAEESHSLLHSVDAMTLYDSTRTTPHAA